jgi:hypothetical protein
MGGTCVLFFGFMVLVKTLLILQHLYSKFVVFELINV